MTFNDAKVELQLLCLHVYINIGIVYQQLCYPYHRSFGRNIPFLVKSIGV